MNEKLETYKELLNVLPRTNVKNAKAYLEKATVMRDEAARVKRQLLREINKRYNDIIIHVDNDELKVIREHLNDLKKNLYLIDEYNTSYEKSEINKYLYNLKKYYKNDINIVNNNIKTIIDKFSLVGVTLTEEDFFYGIEVKEYMSLLLSEEVNYNLLKDKFDNLYWKNPDLLEHIYLNFRYLYFKHKKEFDRYYDNKVKEEGIGNPELYIKNYQDRLWHYILLKESDLKIIQDGFLNGTLDIKEYDYDKISKLESDLFAIEMNENEKFDAISKLSCTLYEYKNYLRYKDIIEEMKKIYNDKNNKNITKAKYKEITKYEGKIIGIQKKIKIVKMIDNKLNRATDFTKYFNGMSSSLTELKRLYREYDEAVFKEKIVTALDDNSSILDLLKLGIAYPINLTKIIKASNPDISDEEIDTEIKYLQRFTLYPNNTIVSNTSIIDSRDLSLLILDKYRLMNLIIRVEQLENVNLDNLITLVKKIFTCYVINRSNTSYADLVSATEMKKILDKEGPQDSEE